MRTLYLDTETTGLSGRDELVELALLDDDGEPLLDTLLRPATLTRWPEAQAIHGISPALVRDAPTLADVLPQLAAHLAGARLVIYNAGYDTVYFPRDVLQTAASIECAMLRFAEHYGDWNDYRGSYRWQRLHVAARFVGHVWRGQAHRARADAEACRSVWRYLELPEGEQRLHRERVENDRAQRLLDL